MWLQLRDSTVGPHAVPLQYGCTDIDLVLDCSPFLHTDQPPQLRRRQSRGKQQICRSNELPEQGCPPHSVALRVDLCRIFLAFLHVDHNDHSSHTQSDG